MKREYRVERISEGAIGTLLFGSSKLPISRIERMLNEYGEDGWELDFMVLESKRFLLFWNREAAVVTLGRSVE